MNNYSINIKSDNHTKSCNIYIQYGIFDNIHTIILNEIKKIQISKILILTDNNVKNLYAKRLENKLKNKIKTLIYSIKPGESEKNYKTKIKIESFMFKNHFKSDSLIIIIGGGVIGDIGGFVASTFHRGIPYINIPTTLLSQIDSSIGGKTAINNKFGKNLIGTFYNSIMILIDPQLLTSLNYENYKQGISEIIKHSLIMDKDLFCDIEKNKEKLKNKDIDYLIKIIYQNCKIKVNIIEKDYKESNLRNILNFGHTIGHAIENITKYKYSHGICIAYGILVETLISEYFNLNTNNNFKRIYNIINYFNLINKRFNNLNAIKIYKISKKDKKNQEAQNPYYVLLNNIGTIMKINSSYKIQVKKEITIDAIKRLRFFLN